MRVKTIMLLFFFALTPGLRSQEASFNNSNQSLIYLNPSFSGSNGYLRNQTDYRNQWPNLSGSYVFYNTSFDGFINAINGGVSISAYSNDVGKGLIKQKKFSAAYAQYISIPNSQIQIIPSAQLIYGLNTLDRSKYNGGVSYPNYGLSSKSTTTSPTELVSYFDITAGLLVKLKGSYFGASCSNILSPNISFTDSYKMPLKILIHASTNWTIGPRTSSNVFCSFSAQQNYYYTVNARFLNTFNDAFLYGLGYKHMYDNSLTAYEIERNGNYACFYIGLRRKAFTVNYSYDISIAQSYGYSYGSHELSFSIALNKKGTEKIPTDLESK